MDKKPSDNHSPKNDNRQFTIYDDTQDGLEVIDDTNYQPIPTNKVVKHPWRILIVDDEQEVHDATEFALKKPANIRAAAAADTRLQRPRSDGMFRPLLQHSLSFSRCGDGNTGCRLAPSGAYARARL